LTKFDKFPESCNILINVESTMGDYYHFAYYPQTQRGGVGLNSFI